MYQPFHWLSFHSLFRSRLMQSLWIKWDFFHTQHGRVKDHNMSILLRSGVCSCRSGYVDWKWECHPVVGLGESCITSAQCHSKVKIEKNWKCHIFRNETELLQDDGPSHVCNPITHKCSCERGYTPALSESGDKALVCRKLGAVSWQLKYLF